MSGQSLVSVIIPVFNRPRMLVEAVQSVQEQTWSNTEIIVIDDGSTDDTAEVARGLADRDSRIVVQSTENGGPGSARNAGVELAKGDYIQFLDSDDLLCTNKLSDALEVFRRDLACDIVYSPTDLLFVDTGVTENAFGKTGQPGAKILPEFLRARWWKTPSPMYRARIIREAGPILALVNEEDWEFDCRLAVASPKLGFSARTGSIVRMHSDERLSKPDTRDTKLWKSRSTAHLEVWKHVEAAGLSFQSAEVKHFVASTFLLARQCGAAGLTEQSRDLITVARNAANRGGHSDFQMKIYASAAGAIGWKLSGRLASLFDQMRSVTRWSQSKRAEREAKPA